MLFLLFLHHAGIVVDDAQEMLLVVHYQYGVYLVLVHDVLYLCNLGGWRHMLGSSGHDVAHSLVEEFCLPFLHGTTYVAVGNESDDTVFLVYRYAQS